jgi:hypothetical protein
MELLDQVCQRLEEKGFSVNPLKCEFAVKESDFLGHWLTPTGVKPLKQKVQGMLDMKAPEDLSQLCSFLGLVTYYRDMWPRRSHILTPLMDVLGTKVFVWNDEHQKSFLQIKAVIAKDTLMTYADHNKPYKIETDSSDYQLGGWIFQMHFDPKQGKEVEWDIAFYTCKLNSVQKNYTTLEKELLSIVEILKEFRSTLLGAEIVI